MLLMHLHRTDASEDNEHVITGTYRIVRNHTCNARMCRTLTTPALYSLLLPTQMDGTRAITGYSYHIPTIVIPLASSDHDKK